MKFSSLHINRPLFQYSLLAASILIFAFACTRGGGGGIFATPEGASQGRFLDGPVQGLHYDSLEWVGETDEQGSFFYKPGEIIEFSIGGVVLGTCAGKAIITPVDIVPGASDATHPMVVNISQFLQSLDLDGDPSNGIFINEDMRTALKGFNVDFSDPDFEDNPDVQRMFDKLNEMGIYAEDEERGLISAADAQIHLEETLIAIEEEALAAEEALRNMKLNAIISSPLYNAILVQNWSINLQGIAVGGTPPYSYSWNIEDGQRFLKGENPGWISFDRPGIYSVLLTVMDETGDTDSDFRYITIWDPSTVDPSLYGYPPVWDVPIVAMVNEPQDLSVTVGESLYLPVEITKGNPPFMYMWLFDSTVQYSWDMDPLDATFTFTEAGRHTITILLKDSTVDDWNQNIVIEVSGTTDW